MLESARPIVLSFLRDPIAWGPELIVLAASAHPEADGLDFLSYALLYEAVSRAIDASGECDADQVLDAWRVDSRGRLLANRDTVLLAVTKVAASLARRRRVRLGVAVHELVRTVVCFDRRSGAPRIREPSSIRPGEALGARPRRLRSALVSRRAVHRLLARVLRSHGIEAS